MKELRMKKRENAKSAKMFRKECKELDSSFRWNNKREIQLLMKKKENIRISN
jgi:prephenate dehydrogenase